VKGAAVRTLLLTLAGISVVFGLMGCERRVESFSLEAYAGGPATGNSRSAESDPSTEDGRLSVSVPLREKPGAAAEQEGLLLAADEGMASPDYKVLYRKAGLDGESWRGSVFHIRYSSTVPLVLELTGEADPARKVALPPSEGNVLEVRVPLHSMLLRSFRFVTAENTGPAGFSLRALELYANGRKDKGAGDKGTGAENTGDDGTGDKGTGAGPVLSLGPLISPEGGGSRFIQTAYELEYSYTPRFVQAALEEEERNVVLELGGKEQVLPIRLFVREGTHSVYFYSRDLPFVPDSITVGKSIPEFRIEKVVTRPVSLLVEKLPAPIPADMGTILRYDTNAWRRSDYELFSWNLFPRILIFDFRDYQLQSAFLKRLSFFVEKKGSTGQLLPNSIIGSLHGWNAHDYRAGDLARFFQLAEERSFELNPEEYLLRDILLKHGIIQWEDNIYTEGEGGILSISRESGDRLRYLFITHEGYHGLYFASEEYRMAVNSIWNDLSEDEKEFWRIFLDWKLYNTRDIDLTMNEFQAYLMQQHLSYVDTYFKEYTIPRLVRRYPEYLSRGELFLELYPEHFIRSAGRIQDVSRSVAGISAGDLVCVRESPVIVRKSEDLSP